MKALLPIFLILAISSTLSLHAQTQKGVDIDGESADDQSGNSVSMPDENTIAIGALYNDGSGSDAGHVRIYRWNGNAWVQKGMDIDGEAADDFFGTSVSMADSNTVAIGANENDGNGFFAGHVRVHTWNGSAWVQKGVDIDGEAPGDYSGISVSMPDVNTVAIGADGNDGNGTSAGHVRIHSWNGSAWVQKGMDIDGEAPDDHSGVSVSMPDENTVAIGANRNDGNGSDAGHVRIYSWNGSAWVQKGADIDGEASGDKSGNSVSMPDANTIAIGANRNDDSGNDAGHVRIYTWNGSTWVQKGADIDGEATSDRSGHSVSMPDANTVAIGADGNDGNGSIAGHVRIYSWNGSVWVQKGADVDGEASGDRSGYSVSMPDANTVAIGATLNDGNGNAAGHVRVYSICTTDISVSNSGPTLTANATGASYQWLDCNNGFSPIGGANNQSYTVATNGNYAVEITLNGCTDTSACEAVSNVGVLENSFDNSTWVYPNPTAGEMTIELGTNHEKVSIIVRNSLGQEILRKLISGSTPVQFEIPGEAGVYLLEVIASNKMEVLKVVKE